MTYKQPTMEEAARIGSSEGMPNFNDMFGRTALFSRVPVVAGNGADLRRAFDQFMAMTKLALTMSPQRPHPAKVQRLLLNGERYWRITCTTCRRGSVLYRSPDEAEDRKTWHARGYPFMETLIDSLTTEPLMGAL